MLAIWTIYHICLQKDTWSILSSPQYLGRPSSPWHFSLYLLKFIMLYWLGMDFLSGFWAISEGVCERCFSQFMKEGSSLIPIMDSGWRQWDYRVCSHQFWWEFFEGQLCIVFAYCYVEGSILTWNNQKKKIKLDISFILEF